MLLVALAACLGACYIISLKNAEKKLSIMGSCTWFRSHTCSPHGKYVSVSQPFWRAYRYFYTSHSALESEKSSPNAEKRSCFHPGNPQKSKPTWCSWKFLFQYRGALSEEMKKKDQEFFFSWRKNMYSRTSDLSVQFSWKSCCIAEKRPLWPVLRTCCREGSKRDAPIRHGRSAVVPALLDGWSWVCRLLGHR